MRLMIDPGHGGGDLGIVRGDLVEKDVNLELAKELALSLHGLPVDVAMTRYDDRNVTLSQRGELSSAHEADLVLSIHVNGGASHLQGADLFHWPGNTVGGNVAAAIGWAMPLRLRSKRLWGATDNAGDGDDWLQRPRNVLEPHAATAVLVECGYATHPGDRDYLLTSAGRSSVVCALRAGVCRWLELEGRQSYGVG